MSTRTAVRPFLKVLAWMVLLAPSSATATNLFVSNYDDFYGSIYEITPSHNVSVFANNSGNVFYSDGLAFDARGNLYDGTESGREIIEFSPSGSQTTFLNGSPGQLTGLAFGANGNLFASDWTEGEIAEFTPSGVRTTIATGLYDPLGLAFNSAGDLFVANGGNPSGPNGAIYEFTPNGTRSTFATGLVYPEGLAFDASGDLFVTAGNSQTSSVIDKFTPAGAESTFASGLAYAGGLAFDSTGNLYEADQGSGNVFEFSPNGTKSTFATGLDQPVFLAFAVPEPSTLLLAAIGMAGLTLMSRRRRGR